MYQAENTVTVASVAEAQTLIATPSEQASAVSQTESDLNFIDTGGGGHFNSTATPDTAFPGMTIGETSESNYVLDASGNIVITNPGYYTFGVNSNDGYTLTVKGANFTSSTNTTLRSGSVVSCDKLQAATDSFATTYLAAGSYPVDLVYFQAADQGELEFFDAAGGPYTSFVAASFALVAAAGGLQVMSNGGSGTPLSAVTQTNVQTAVNSRDRVGRSDVALHADGLHPDAATLASLTSLTLRMQYTSGFVAYLNGVEVASSNAPALPAWNSQATEYGSSVVQGTTYEDWDLTPYISDLSSSGNNVLAIQTLMASPTDPNFFVMPELSAMAITTAGQQFFLPPTPGGFNTPDTWQANVSYSQTDGLESSSFPLSLSTVVPGATIRYTTDSSTPDTKQIYAPITYSGTTATVTCPNNGFTVGQEVQISGASPSLYDGTFLISGVNPGANTFTYNLSSSPAGGLDGTNLSGQIGTLTYNGVTTATATCESGSTDLDGFYVGQSVQIAGATPSAYDGVFNITGVSTDSNNGTTSFSYTMSSSPGANGSGSLMMAYGVSQTGTMTAALVPVPGASEAVSGISYSGTLATVTCMNHGFYTGQQVQISGATPATYDGFFNITVLGPNIFTYTLPSSPGANASGTIAAALIPVGTNGLKSITGISSSGTTATVTCVSGLPYNFYNGQEVQILGASPWQYDGIFPISGFITGGTTFTYTMSSSPGVAASGGAMTAAAVSTWTYTSPITISTTTDVRAVGVWGGEAGTVATESYVFPAAVVNQPASPNGFPSSWGSQTAAYAMNPVITQTQTTAQWVTDLESLPTISIVTDVPNMWDTSTSQTTNTGIYSNNANLIKTGGVSMETPASFEYFNASGSIDVQANVGLTMEGANGREPQYEKHNFKVDLSSDYGPSTLNYPLFPGDPVTSFKDFTLKAGYNDTWSDSGSGTPPGDGAQYMRDAFSSLSQLAMGQLSWDVQYVLLYVDGLFWGVYYMLERPDANFAASHLGGTAAQWEANNAGHAISGSGNGLPLWTQLINFPSSSGLGNNTVAYFEAVQGNNASGTPSTTYTDLLDMTNYIDYLLMNFYVGNVDWPWHNFYAAIDSADPTGFKFFDWDTEWILGFYNTSWGRHQHPHSKRCHRRHPQLRHQHHERGLAVSCAFIPTPSSTWPLPTRSGRCSLTTAR